MLVTRIFCLSHNVFQENPIKEKFLFTLNSLPYKMILDLTELEVFADDELEGVQN